MARKKTMFSESLIQNTHTYLYYIDRITNMAVSRFKWKGWPDSVDVRYLENALFLNGSAICFREDVLNEILCLDQIVSGRLDYYGNPVLRRAYSRYNKYQCMLKNTNSVIIWNDYLRKNTYPDIEQFARRLYICDRIIDVNLNAQKTPVMLQGDESDKLTLLNIYKKWDGNEPLITTYKSFDKQALTVLKTDAPFIVDKVYEYKVDLWNECMSFLGISNVAIQKKERMVRDEVTRSMGGTISSRQSYLDMRQNAADRINSMFGLNVSVEFNEDLDNNGGEEDGGFYHTSEVNTGNKSGLI